MRESSVQYMHNFIWGMVLKVRVCSDPGLFCRIWTGSESGCCIELNRILAFRNKLICKKHFQRSEFSAFNYVSVNLDPERDLLINDIRILIRTKNVWICDLMISNIIQQRSTVHRLTGKQIGNSVLKSSLKKYLLWTLDLYFCSFAYGFEIAQLFSLKACKISFRSVKDSVKNFLRGSYKFA
jgi:hypothetical protein